ncbi:MAG: ATP-grasp domain-containing protein [Deltaproteobacteria bacterium]|nr:ATP-grasp domain-containing protein [Deltaproteobacteria bacterium]
MSVVSRLLQTKVAHRLQFEANRHWRPHDESRRLLVVGSGAPGMRGYILESICRHGFPVTLLCAEPPTWEQPFIDQFVVADFADFDAVVRKVREAVLGRPVRGCLTYVETDGPLAARLSRELGLGLYGPETAERVRDKHLMRQTLRDAGLPMPVSVVVENRDLRGAVAKVGLPAVLKPIRGEGSINVLKLEDDAGVVEAQRLMQASRSDAGWRYGGYLIEQYVDGTEFSVESIVANGQVLHAAVTDKYKGAEPYFEELSHSLPSQIASHEEAEILDVVTRAIVALGLDNCAVHTELKRGSLGTVIIETAGRLAGGRIPRLVELARGLDLADAAARAAVGLPVSLHASREQVASVGFFVPAREQRQDLDLAARPLVPGLVDFDFWGRAGQLHGVPPQQFLLRLGYAVGVADTYEESRRVLERTRLLVTAQTGLELLPFPIGR